MAKHAVPEEVYDAAYNLRVAGMSERAIYERLRETVTEYPSYRDLRGFWGDQGVGKRAQATVAREAGAFFGSQGSANYRERLRVTREVDQTPDAKEALDRKFLLGYLARAKARVSDLSDDGLAESLASIYEGEGS